MKKQTQSYFTFSKKELNGILILFILITLILTFPFCYRLLDEPEDYDLSTFRKEIADFKASVVKGKGDYRSLREKIEDKEMEPGYFEFDPNDLPETGWLRLGLSQKQARVIHNYISRGGKFYRDEDLKKIYSIREEQYIRLKPYIRIQPDKLKPLNSLKFNDPKPIYRRREAVIVELNSADSAALDQVRGIGPAFASRIIRFRNRLGGFHRKEQLKEVYGMDSLRYAQLENEVSADPSSLSKLNINTATFEQMRNHPYLSYKQINAIIQYRRQHGNYSTADDLKKVLILNEEIIRKIEPYLAF